MIQKAVITVILFFGSSIASLLAQREGIQFDFLTFEEAMVKARQENKLLFIDCYTDWCGPCKKLDRDFFSDKQVGEFFSRHFVNLKVNMEKDEGAEVAKNYSIQSYPTMLFINPHSKRVVYRLVGLGGDIDWLIDAGEKALDPLTNLDGLKQMFEENSKDSELLSTYLSALSSSQFIKERNDVLSFYLADLSDDEIVSTENWEIMNQYVTDVEEDSFDFLLGHKEDFATIIDKILIDKKIDDVFRTSLQKMTFRKRVAEEHFPQQKFEKSFLHLQNYSGENSKYYLALLKMIEKVQEGDYVGMLDQMQLSLDGEGVVAPDAIVYFVWLNLSYLFECTDEKIIDQGIRYTAYIRPENSAQTPDWLGLKARLYAAKGDFATEQKLRNEAAEISGTNQNK